MKRGITSALVALPAFLLLASAATGEDWPQWMGPTRNGHVTGFTPPKAWPKSLTEKWKVKVGAGVSTPALVGDKLYVFSREGNSEVTRCLNVADGKEVWTDKYDAPFTPSADSLFPGPRSSVAVGDGMVVTLGVNGTVSCLAATDGKKVWRHDDTGKAPRFHTSCSPLIVDKLVVVQVGDEKSGSVVAYELATGNEKWKWGSEGTGYASPTLMTVDGTKMVIAETMQNIVGLGAADGKPLWKTPFPFPAGGGKGGGQNYNSSTPMVNGSTLVFAGTNRGTNAVRIEKTAGGFAAKELWSNKDYSVIYNTPVVHDKLVYGMTNRSTLYAVSADSGAKAWDYELPMTGGKGGKGAPPTVGYGSIVDAGAVMMALTPAGKLMVFEPSDKEYKELASYAVGTQTYAYPIVSGNRIIIKDADSVTLYTVE